MVSRSRRSLDEETAGFLAAGPSSGAATGGRAARAPGPRHRQGQGHPPPRRGRPRTWGTPGAGRRTRRGGGPVQRHPPPGGR